MPWYQLGIKGSYTKNERGGSSQCGQGEGVTSYADVRTIIEVRCNDTACCGQRRSFNNDVFPGRFLPMPVSLYNNYKGT